MRRDLYSEVSARIVTELEAGAAPWIKPWSATAGANTPCNAVTNRPYSGCNVVLLWMAQSAGYRTPRYLTFKQALELDGRPRMRVGQWLRSYWPETLLFMAVALPWLSLFVLGLVWLWQGGRVWAWAIAAATLGLLAMAPVNLGQAARERGGALGAWRFGGAGPWLECR